MDAVKFLKEAYRMCSAVECTNCPLNNEAGKPVFPCKSTETDAERKNPEKYVSIVEKWSAEHPVKTRQSKFLKAYPNADITEGVLFICPRRVDLNCLSEEECKEIICPECMKKYWLSKEE